MRFTVRAVSGHGPAMHSTRLHANAAAAAAAAAADGDDQVNVIYCDSNKVADNSKRTHDAAVAAGAAMLLFMTITAISDTVTCAVI